MALKAEPERALPSFMTASLPTATYTGSMRPQIGLLHLRVVGKRRRGSGQHALSDLQHGCKIGNFERELDRLLGEQDGQALAVQAAEGLVHRLHHSRRQSQRGL